MGVGTRLSFDTPIGANHTKVCLECQINGFIEGHSTFGHSYQYAGLSAQLLEAGFAEFFACTHHRQVAVRKPVHLLPALVEALRMQISSPIGVGINTSTHRKPLRPRRMQYIKRLLHRKSASGRV